MAVLFRQCFSPSREGSHGLNGATILLQKRLFTSMKTTQKLVICLMFSNNASLHLLLYLLLEWKHCQHMEFKSLAAANRGVIIDSIRDVVSATVRRASAMMSMRYAISSYSSAADRPERQSLQRIGIRRRRRGKPVLADREAARAHQSPLSD
jgi:citrate synthase